MTRMNALHLHALRACLVLLAGALWLATALPVARAQPTADLSLVSRVNPDTRQLEVTVRLAARPKEGLGVSTIVFRFDPEAFALSSDPKDVTLAPGTDYRFHNGFGKKCYAGSTVTRPLKDEISVNIDYLYTPFNERCGVDGGRVIPKKGIELATVFFNIVNPGSMTELVFETDPLITALFADDDDRRPTRFATGTFAGTEPEAWEAGKTLASFAAEVDGPAVALHWQAAAGTNSAGFEVHSKYAEAHLENDWKVLGFVEATGAAAETQTYSYRVEDLEPGRHVFRLKRMNPNGTFVYSSEIAVTVELVETYRLSALYPNPFNAQAQFTLAVREEQPVRVEVYDGLGRRVALLHEGKLAAHRSYRFTLAGNGLPSGLYFIRASGETFTGTKQALLVK